MQEPTYVVSIGGAFDNWRSITKELLAAKQTAEKLVETSRLLKSAPFRRISLVCWFFNGQPKKELVYFGISDEYGCIQVEIWSDKNAFPSNFEEARDYLLRKSLKAIIHIGVNFDLPLGCLLDAIRIDQHSQTCYEELKLYADELAAAKEAGRLITDKEDSHETSLWLKLSDTFGNEDELKTLDNLEARLDGLIRGKDLGYVEGHETGDGWRTIFIATEEPRKLSSIVKRILKKNDLVLPGSYLKLTRTGGTRSSKEAILQLR